MSGEEKKPILQDSGIYTRAGGSGQRNQSGQQHLVIQPIEFDHKHKNMYGYLSLAAFILILINYIMIKERTCQFTFVNGIQNYDLIQSFHLTAIIVAIIVFILSYFNFALVIYEFKLIFYTTATIIFICASLLIYNTITIASAPCVSIIIPSGSPISQIPFLALFGAKPVVDGNSNIFSARDGVGITVFIFDIIAASLLFFAGRNFYKRS